MHREDGDPRTPRVPPSLSRWLWGSPPWLTSRLQPSGLPLHANVVTLGSCRRAGDGRPPTKPPGPGMLLGKRVLPHPRVLILADNIAMALAVKATPFCRKIMM